MAVVESLEKIGLNFPLDVISILEKLVDDRNLKDVQRTARNIVWKLVRPQLEESGSLLLTRLVQSSSPYLRDNAKKIQSIRDPGCRISDLAQFSEDEDANIHAEASRALWMRVNECVPTQRVECLVEILNNSKSNTHIAARHMLRETLDSLLSSSGYYDQMRHILKSERGTELRDIAQESLRHLRDTSLSIDLLMLKTQLYGLDPDLIRFAYLIIDVALEASEVEHLLRSSLILADHKVDLETIIAGMLYGVLDENFDISYLDYETVRVDWRTPFPPLAETYISLLKGYYISKSSFINLIRGLRFIPCQ